MLAYKGFKKGFVCRGYKFNREGWNEEKKANCVKNGFHAATNPLDCLRYYHDFKNSVYAVVECAGDMDEDEIDSKITCTRMRIIKELSPADFIIEALLYIAEHPKMKRSSCVKVNQSVSGSAGYAISEGANPKCMGTSKGDVLGYIRNENDKITGLYFAVVDGESVKPGEWYSYNDLAGRKVS